MKLPRRNFLHLAACAAALPAVSRFARAQAYPARPVRLIVGAPPQEADSISTSGTCRTLAAASASSNLGRSKRRPLSTSTLADNPPVAAVEVGGNGLALRLNAKAAFALPLR